MLTKAVFGFSLMVLVVLEPKVHGGACHGGRQSSGSHPQYIKSTDGRRNISREKRWRLPRDDHSHEDGTWHFGYEDTAEWGEHFADCSGAKQSPVDLNSSIMTLLHVQEPFKFHGYRRVPRKMTITNNGHTVQLTGTWSNGHAPYISGGTLLDKYEFLQLHFHWGTADGTGSEHTVNGAGLPLEMHMVHYKKEYGSPEEAMKCDDGLAVVGILFDIGRKRNSGINLLAPYLRELRSPHTEIPIDVPFPLSRFRLNFPGKYVSYLGSLTTPPCSEIVTWILPATPRDISQHQEQICRTEGWTWKKSYSKYTSMTTFFSQMETHKKLPLEKLKLFRRINLAGGDDHNYRPTNSLNGRLLYYINY